MSLSNDYSLADIAAATGNNGNGGNGGGWGLGGDALIALIVLFLFCGMGWGGMGFGGMGMMGGMGMWPWMLGGFGGGFSGNNAGVQGALTREQACIDQNFNNLARTAEATNSAVNQGFANLNSTICHQQYDTAQMVNGIGNTVQQGFMQAELSRCNQQAALMQQLFQMQSTAQDCCCQTKQAISQANYDAAMRDAETNRLIDRGFCDTNYAQATNTNAIIQNAHSDADRIIARFDAFERNQDKETIANLRQQLQDSRYRESQISQNGAIQSMVSASTAEILHRSGHDCPSAAYIVQPPTPVTFQTNGCGQAVFNGNGNGNCCGYNA